MSLLDWLTFLCCSSVNFSVDVDPKDTSPTPHIVGRAHKGMFEAAGQVAKLTVDTVSDELAAHEDYSLGKENLI